MNTQLPTGTIIFLFTDIEGSTQLYEADPQRMAGILARHHAILTRAIQSQDGHVFQIVGDAFCAAFHTAQDGLCAALAAQRELLAEPWPEGQAVRVRMGLHAGQADLDNENLTAGQYSGYGTLARAQRIMAAGHGGQILLSAAVSELLRDRLPDGVSLRNLGYHQLKGLAQPENIFQANGAGQSATFPPLTTTGRIPTNLPARLTSFIGREKEIAEVKDWLETARLVTLTGSGGVGKTRLAIQVAGELLESYPDGVWLCELALVNDPGQVLQAAARAIGLHTGNEKQVQGSLTEYLRQKTSLLVLDNCEHLIDACAHLAEALLQAAPKIRILTSSREALGVFGERAYQVRSLSLPEAKSPTLAALAESEAAHLFIERANAALPGFAATEANGPAIVQICRRLDGIPLAIELAAARVSVLQVEQIAVRLSDAFRLLTGGSRTALLRQQTLLASIRWSYDLLSDAERVILQRLSVFAGGWTLEAAEAVCGFPPVRGEEVLDWLTHLVNKSLVVTERKQGAETRYHFLETIRQFAKDRLLESGEVAAVSEKHLAYYRSLAIAGEPELYGRGQLAWMQRLETELVNFRTALGWAQESDAEETRLAGLQLILALGWASQYGNVSEGYNGLIKALSISAGMQTTLRAKMLAVTGWLAVLLQINDKAEQYANESMALFQHLGDRARTAFPIAILAALANRNNNFVRAKELAQESLALFEEAGEKWGMRQMYGVLGSANEAQADYVQAEAYYQKGLALSREMEYLDGIGWMLYLLGNLARVRGEYDRAMKYYEEGLAAQKRARSGPVIAWTIGAMAHAAYLQSNYELAQTYCLESLELNRNMGNRLYVSIFQIRLGHIALRLQDYQQSTVACKEGLRLAIEINNADAIAQSLAESGLLAEAEGQAERAIRLFGAAEAIHPIYLSGVWDVIAGEIRQATAELRERVGEVAFQRLWDEGKSMEREQACAYARELLSERVK
jgi:predicted ATPase/class 3 adenylate cyclase